MMDTRIAGNDWPDVIRYSYQKIGKFKSADVMLDLTPYFTQENLDDVSPAFLQSGMYNGKLVAMPHHTDTIALFYNKRMFEEAGNPDSYQCRRRLELGRADGYLSYTKGKI